jgi:hypothetical protein
MKVKGCCAAKQERFERVRWRAKHARAVRHARVLSRFWHTQQGLIWQVRMPPGLPAILHAPADCGPS